MRSCGVGASQNSGRPEPERFTVGGHANADAGPVRGGVYEFVVVGRTRLFVVFADAAGNVVRVRIRRDPAGDEWALPLGRPPKGPIVRPTPGGAAVANSADYPEQLGLNRKRD